MTISVGSRDVSGGKSATLSFFSSIFPTQMSHSYFYLINILITQSTFDIFLNMRLSKNTQPKTSSVL